MNATMNAVIYTEYGTPDVLKVSQVAKPVPTANEVLVRVMASTVEATDVIFRRGATKSARMYTGLRKPKFPTPGSEFAGVVEAVGSGVTRFKVGDAVVGSNSDSFSTNAAYICLPEDSPMTQKPASLTYEEAVSIHPGALTALPNLRDAARVQPGQKVLINGASGSVGASAVQLAKYYGAEVTAVCSTANVELVRSLGADHVIDYKREDFTRSAAQYDVVFDAVGKSSFGQAKRILKPGGLYLTTVVGPTILWQKFWTSKFGSKKANLIFAGLRSNAEKNADLAFLQTLVEAGALQPVIDRCYPLEQVAEAHRYVDTGRKRGNVVLTAAS